MRVDNAIILAAGCSSRFAPLSYEKHKALIEVKGEILIERQIRQLLQSGVTDIYIVSGYKAEQFDYLRDKFNVQLIFNPDYSIRNNHSSIYAVRDILANSYVCSSDNYFPENPFEIDVEDSYYAALYAKGITKEWCLTEDSNNYIDSVSIGGKDTWFMFGHTFWSEEFSYRFIRILLEEYYYPETTDKLWEHIFMDHLDGLKMHIKKYDPNMIFEFDTLDELRKIDNSYIQNTRSLILQNIAERLECKQADLVEVTGYKGLNNSASGFTFVCNQRLYQYEYQGESLSEITERR